MVSVVEPRLLNAGLAEDETIACLMGGRAISVLPMARLNCTTENRWYLKTPGASAHTMHVKEKVWNACSGVYGGKTALFCTARCIDDLHACPLKPRI